MNSPTVAERAAEDPSSIAQTASVHRDIIKIALKNLQLRCNLNAPLGHFGAHGKSLTCLAISVGGGSAGHYRRLRQKAVDRWVEITA